MLHYPRHKKLPKNPSPQVSRGGCLYSYNYLETQRSISSLPGYLGMVPRYHISYCYYEQRRALSSRVFRVFLSDFEVVRLHVGKILHCDQS